MMENKHPENKSSKKVDKVRRKLLIGAAATPLIMTLHASRAMGQKDIGKLVQNPSKAMRDGDGLGYSGLLVGSGGGNLSTELSLYAYLICHGTVVTVPVYANMIASRDTWIVNLVTSLPTPAAIESSADLALLQEAIRLNSTGWSIADGDILPIGHPAWENANSIYKGKLEPEIPNDDDSENPDPFSLLDGFPGG